MFKSTKVERFQNSAGNILRSLHSMIKYKFEELKKPDSPKDKGKCWNYSNAYYEKKDVMLKTG